MPQLVRNVISMYFPPLAGIAAGIFLFPFIVSEVGLTEYGVWLLVSSIAVLFFTDFGMGMSAMRFVANAEAKQDRDELNRVVSTTLALFAALGVAGAAIYAGTMVLLLPRLEIPASSRDVALVMIGSVSVTALVGMPASLFRSVLAGVHRYDRVSAIVVLQHSLRCGLMVVALLVLDAGIAGVIAVEAFVYLLSATLFYVVARRTIPELRISRELVSLELLRRMMRYSLQVFVIVITGLVIIQADGLIIAMFLPVAMVTLYAGAFRLYQICRELAGSATAALIPHAAASAASADWERVRHVLLRGTKYSNAFILLLALPVIMFAEPVLVAWAGEDFADVAVVAQILLISLVVNNNHLAAGSMLIGTGRVAPYAKLHACWALSNIILSVVLVQRFGLKGMALGTAIPIMLLEPLYVRIALREFSVPAAQFVRESVLKPVVPALAAGGALFAAASALESPGIVTILALSAAYSVVFLSLFATMGIGSGERGQLIGWFKPLTPARLAHRLGAATSSGN
jgi:O-antigen/teichoic acid export membrane protein